MPQLAQFIATLSCTLFAGAAVYISFVEHPARMGCPTEMAATVWAPSYKRATLMQAPLVAAGIILSVVPFTLFAIAPTNRQLLAPGRDLASSDTRALLERWGTLHAVRSGLSLVASAIYFWLLAQA